MEAVRRLVRDKNRNILVSVVFSSFWSDIRIFWFKWYFLFFGQR